MIGNSPETDPTPDYLLRAEGEPGRIEESMLSDRRAVAANRIAGVLSIGGVVELVAGGNTFVGAGLVIAGTVSGRVARYFWNKTAASSAASRPEVPSDASAEADIKAE